MKNLFKKSVIAAITWEAKRVLKKYKPKIVAVTGTVGKTSTKDAIYAALLPTLSVRKTKKSQNSEIGLPLTILGAANPAETWSVLPWLNVLIEGAKLIMMPHHYPEWLVLEIGADHPGDIQAATEWVKPDIAVVTKLSKLPVHVEFFASVEEVFKEKGFLVRALKPTGTLVLNGEDEDVLKYEKEFAGKVVRFKNPEKYEAVYESGRPVGADIVIEGQEIRVPGIVGNHLALPLSAALKVAEAVGENLEIAAEALSKAEPTPGRMRLIEGEHGATIIDDTYNSSPVAAEEALKTLKSLKGKRKIAVLGDMLELGRFSADAHKKMGELAARCADIFVTVGLRSRYAAEAAAEVGMSEEEIMQFDDSREAGEALEKMIREGDIVLVKGSQSIRMERVVEALMKHPEDKEKLLVRQDEEWKRRK